jgi:hypothetical protein
LNESCVASVLISSNWSGWRLLPTARASWASWRGCGACLQPWATLLSFDALRPRAHERGSPKPRGVPPPAPDFHDPETDELEALLEEIERVCPPDERSEGFGLEFPHGRTAALAAFRRLPNRSAEVVASALAEPPEEQP